MNKLALAAVALIAVSSPLTRAQNPGPSSGQKEAEDYIRKSESEWAESVANGDATVIERILADDFLGVDTKGKLYDKPTMISETKDGPKHFVSNHLEDVKIRFFGDNTAVAQGSESWVRRNGERGRFVWTDTWILRNDRWQIVAAEDLVPPAKPEKNK
jgi:ketosteroid isomerase-like protein